MCTKSVVIGIEVGLYDKLSMNEGSVMSDLTSKNYLIDAMNLEKVPSKQTENWIIIMKQRLG